jgi:long-chain fatty acid transport protein
MCMKRLLIALLFAGLMAPTMVHAGGIVTNANQSAAYIRMPAQDATLSIDAVYYNPAGLAFLEDGFYVSLNNQYITQTRTLSSTFPGMNRTEFKGGVTAPLFPGVYLAYKKDKLALSFGFNPIGGGGSAKFDNGLPSFEEQAVAANVPGALTLAGVPTDAYRLDANFEGKSTMFGFQINASYKVTEKLALSLGVRYITAKNSYKGGMGLFINPNQPAFGADYDGTNMVSAPKFFTDAATTLNGWSTGSTATASGLSAAVSGGAITNGTAVSSLDAATKAAVLGLCGAAGIDASGYNVGTAIATLNGIAPVFAGKATAMTGYAAATADKSVDNEQNGSGFSPIVGFDYKVSDKLNIGFRYEYKATMIVKNKTKVDNTGLFPDGASTPNDMPTTVALGVSYKPTSKLLVSTGIHCYFDKTADYGKKIDGVFVKNSKVIDNNFIEAALGVEYSITEKLLVSAGYLRTQSGANMKFQSDLSHSLSTNTFGGGAKYNVTDKIGVNFGLMYSSYIDQTKKFTIPVDYTETYKRSAFVVAVGVDLKF